MLFEALDVLSLLWDPLLVFYSELAYSMGTLLIPMLISFVPLHHILFLISLSLPLNYGFTVGKYFLKSRFEALVSSINLAFSRHSCPLIVVTVEHGQAAQKIIKFTFAMS